MKFSCAGLLLLLSLCVRAQNITGTWEGIMDNELLQVNALQQGSQVCGYTYDHFIDNKAEFCRAYYTAAYIRNERAWQLNGVSFIQNSGGHVLMRLKLWRDITDNVNQLHAVVRVQGLFSLFDEGDTVQLRRVNPQPTKLNGLPLCIEPLKAPINPGLKPSPRTKPSPRLKPSPGLKSGEKKKPASPANPGLKSGEKKSSPGLKSGEKKDSIIAPSPADPLLKKMQARKKVAITTLTVDTRQIILDVYDNGTIDGDTVSIFYNGRLLVGHKRLSEEPLTIHLDLDQTSDVHELTMYAENLGSIPPNTALIVVKAGKKRYELHSSASLTENAVLLFEYKKDSN